MIHRAILYNNLPVISTTRYRSGESRVLCIKAIGINVQWDYLRNISSLLFFVQNMAQRFDLKNRSVYHDSNNKYIQVNMIDI